MHMSAGGASDSTPEREASEGPPARGTVLEPADCGKNMETTGQRGRLRKQHSQRENTCSFLY